MMFCQNTLARNFLTPACLTLAILGIVSLAASAEPPARIAWYGQLADGLAEAQRTGRPILLVSGAPQCHGVPGVW